MLLRWLPRYILQLSLIVLLLFYTASISSTGSVFTDSASIAPVALTAGTWEVDEGDEVETRALTFGDENAAVTDEEENEDLKNDFGKKDGTSPLVLNEFNPVQGIFGQEYGHQFSVTGGLKPYTFDLTGGSLPAGMGLNEEGGLGGTPAETGTFTFSVTVTDAAGETDTRRFTLIVVDDDEDGSLGDGFTGDKGIDSTETENEGDSVTVDDFPGDDSEPGDGIGAGTI